MKSNMKRICMTVVCVCAVIATQAKEGMWVPSQISVNEQEMKRMGMRMSASDIYSTEHPSIKDAIVQFNGGCTASFISADGLMLTNHHCGYSSIQSHSTVEHDYLSEGFWAMNRSEELPNKGYTAMMVVRIEDVTRQVMQGIPDTLNDAVCSARLDSNINRIRETAVKGTKYDAVVKPFFFGLKYFLFVTLTYRDVRLVGAPPSAIGKFGAETDNWMWPRHSCDFALFRVYADKNNDPADYSPDNVPYHPDYFLPVSLKGIHQGDFTLVYGFPGRTQEYLPSFVVDYIKNTSNPARIDFREGTLEIIEQAMKQSDAHRISYAARYARISNYYKKWIGENTGLARMHALEHKRSMEADLHKQILLSGNRKYINLLKDYKRLYSQAVPYLLAKDCYVEMLYYGTSVLRFAIGFEKLTEQLQKTDFESNATIERKRWNEKAERFFNQNDLYAERKILASLLESYVKHVEKDFQSEVIREAELKYASDFDAFTLALFKKSVLLDREKLHKLITGFNKGKSKIIVKDPLYLFAQGLRMHYKQRIAPQLRDMQAKLNSKQKLFMQALTELLPDYKMYYPDANGTLRVSYGKIREYSPADAIEYAWYTTLKGVMEKDQPGNAEFDVPEKLEHLYASANFAPYGDGRQQKVCFIATNHTTGGNSGSPVLDAQGCLIGLNFDRCWEGTMSDIYFDDSLCRNISVDIRYVLFIIDRFAGAAYLLNEMKLVK